MKRLTTIVPAALAGLLLSACDASVYSLPLPGGPDVGEDPMTIGGGGDVQVTQGGTFTVAAGATSTPTPLPLTGVTIAGMCELGTPPAPTPEFVLARIVLSTTGGTMDAFTSVGSGPTGSGATLGGTSLTTAPVAAAGFAPVSNGLGSAIVMASGATATITFGARADATARNCTYLWQATVAPN